ncbi:unnamed protein product [Kluyveromyces dobzhanskii CBS 2104]|uniref:Mediator of RNA polymerase II transcription subunit 17 n=1 Tax=Kluyveromyces dobzhanskii CBS 2104 TaxID=1427455 RepID=A0A0A8L6B3_9SACH|nr:unnamed protein product [Kluyveromyces dobzhanskii CBS 2104]
MDGFSEYDPEKGIPLAIDPNLINIPATSPLAAADGNGHEETNNLDSTATPVDDADLTKSQTSLIQNPYEYFGQMSLEQFIPLMLQQRGAGTKFADINEDTLLEEISQENKAKTDDQAQDPNVSSDAILESSGENLTAIDQDIAGTSIKDVDGDIQMDDSLTESHKPVQVDESNVNETDSELQLPAKVEESITPEEFVLIKKKVLEHVNMAVNESSLSLEFVSLLLSSTRTSAGISSMSPYLKKIAPPSSLNADKVSLDMLEEHEKLTYDIIHKGWNLRSLEECRKLLKQHYLMLSKSVETECIYWKQILDNITNKDVLFKTKDRNTGRRTLGIKYGFDDSGSCYSAEKGVALLRAASEGSQLELVPVLDSGIDIGINKSSSEQFVRIRIFTKIEQEDDFLLSGQSSLNELLVSSNSDIKSQIAKLRFFIFEKELMYQLKKEAAQLLPYGVSVESENKVVLELSNEKIEFELINLDEEVISSHQQEAPKVNDKRANLMLVMLNMLLVVMYKKQLWKRLNPNPHTSKSAVGYGKDLVILRAILGKIRHKKYTQVIEKIINNTIIEKKEDLIMTTNADTVPTDSEPSKNKELATLQREIALFDKILCMPRTDFTTIIPDKGKLEVSLRSTNHCNAVIHMKYTDAEQVVKFDTRFSEFTEFEEFLNFVYNEFLI